MAYRSARSGQVTARMDKVGQRRGVESFRKLGHCSKLRHHFTLGGPSWRAVQWTISASCPVQMSKFFAGPNTHCRPLIWQRSYSLHDLLFNLSWLKNLDIFVPQGLGIDSLIDFVFLGAPEHGVIWREIRNVRVGVGCDSTSEASYLQPDNWTPAAL